MGNLIRNCTFNVYSSLLTVGVSLLLVSSQAHAEDMMGSMPAQKEQTKPMQKNSADATDTTSDHDQMTKDHDQMKEDHDQMADHKKMKGHEKMMEKKRKAGMEKGQQKMNTMKKKSMPMDMPGMMGDDSMKPDMPKDPDAGMDHM